MTITVATMMMTVTVTVMKLQQKKINHDKNNK